MLAHRLGTKRLRRKNPTLLHQMLQVCHTVRNLHFLSKDLTLNSRENYRFFGWKTRENIVF